MNRLTSKHIAVATAASCLLLASCMSNAERTFGRGGLENANVVANVLDDVGVYEKKKEPVDYSPRPPLDIPNSTENLPKPKKNLENQNTETSYYEPAENQNELSGKLGQVPISDVGSSPSELQKARLIESEEDISQNDPIRSSSNSDGKKNQECELYPSDEENDCHLISPPETYN